MGGGCERVHPDQAAVVYMPVQAHRAAKTSASRITVDSRIPLLRGPHGFEPGDMTSGLRSDHPRRAVDVGIDLRNNTALVVSFNKPVRRQALESTTSDFAVDLHHGPPRGEVG